MKPRIQVVFTGLCKDKPSWPHINYDVEKRAAEVMPVLEKAIPDVEFSHVVYYSREEAEKGYAKNEKGKYDGWLVYISCIWTGIPQFYAENVRPVVLADELYSGSGEFLTARSLIEEKNLSVATVSSSNFTDVIETVRLLEVMVRMRQTKVLVFSNNAKPWGATPEEIAATEEVFGTKTILKTGHDLQKMYDAVAESEAGPVRDRWMGEAKAIVEPDAAEILKSARMYLAVKKYMAEEKADAVSIDCLSLFYAGGASAYPCLTFFQLNNDGSTGVCEGDLHSTISQLLFRYLCGRPAYVSDPVIDEAAGQIIYAHCVATNRPHGPEGAACPYIIRSHAEDLKGASIQSLLPLGQTVTTIAVSPQHKVMGLHTARTVANVDEEKACRTKLAAEVDTDKILTKYHTEYFGWHQVTCYGDHRRAMKQLARLYGLRCIEQDR